jgi:hypothetical protein
MLQSSLNNFVEERKKERKKERNITITIGFCKNFCKNLIINYGGDSVDTLSGYSVLSTEESRLVQNSTYPADVYELTNTTISAQYREININPTIPSLSRVCSMYII